LTIGCNCAKICMIMKHYALHPPPPMKAQEVNHFQ
jgi:hypothetical protein